MLVGLSTNRRHWRSHGANVGWPGAMRSAQEGHFHPRHPFLPASPSTAPRIYAALQALVNDEQIAEQHFAYANLLRPYLGGHVGRVDHVPQDAVVLVVVEAAEVHSVPSPPAAVGGGCSSGVGGRGIVVVGAGEFATAFLNVDLPAGIVGPGLFLKLGGSEVTRVAEDDSKCIDSR